MSLTHHNPAGLFPPHANYAHAVEVPPGARTLYVSVLNGFEADGVAIVRENLGDHLTARTVVVQQLLEPEWLIEVEAVAAKVD